MIYRVGDLELDTDTMVARRGGEVLRLRPRPFALLQILIENHDRVVSKQEIVQAVWSGRAVSESAVLTAIRDLRRALGDDAAEGGVIRTFYGRGLRLMAPAGEDAAGPGAGTPPPSARIGRAAQVLSQVSSPSATPNMLLGVSPIDDVRHLLGVYHTYYRTPSWPNAIKCGVSILTEVAGRIAVRTTEHGKDEVVGIRQRARYRGFAEFIDGRIYVVEQNTRPPRAVCLSALDAPHPFQPNTMTGLMMGSSWRAAGAPYTTRVIWRRVPGEMTVREAILRSGPYAEDGNDLDAVILESLGADCLTFHTQSIKV